MAYTHTPHPQVHGERCSSSPLPLGTTTDNFEQGEEDVFEVSLPSDMGTVTAVTIGHDNTRPYPEWHLDRMEMESGCGGERYLFPCGRYVARRFRVVIQVTQT